MTSSPKSDELFQQAMKAWETAAKAGVKMQEEIHNWVRQMFCESSTLNDWYQKGQKMMNEAIARSPGKCWRGDRADEPAGGKQPELDEEGFGNPRCRGDRRWTQKFSDWWQAALDTMRINNQAVLKANSRILNTWAGIRPQSQWQCGRNSCPTWRKKPRNMPRRWPRPRWNGSKTWPSRLPDAGRRP